MVRQLGSGGTERQMTELAKTLDRERFAVHVACFVPGGFRRDELRARGIPVLEIPLRSFIKPHTISALGQFRRYVRENGIRLVHTFDYPASIFGVTAARLGRVPHVLSSQRGYRRLYQPKYRHLLRISDWLADGVVVNCEAMRRHLLEDCSVPPCRIHLCHNGLDLGVFRYAPRERPPCLEGARTVIGTVSVLRPEKGLPVLLEAFAQVRIERPGVRLLVVGSGPVAADLEALAGSLGIREACHFEPATSDVASWLRAIDVFVLPSLSEALSNSLMEAMACGCCVVASNVGGNPELVTGETGVLFEKGNTAELASRLIELVDRPDLRARLGECAAARIRSEFTIEASARRMGEIYEDFLGQS
jgi:glycosyltransferase involved in cell wall biosynthesis